MTITDLLSSLETVRSRGTGKWTAQCPAHADRSPSLSVREGDDGRLLVHCFAGCTVSEICSALGVSVRDLFQGPRRHASRGKEKVWRFDVGATTFRLQLHALDLRLRAEGTFTTATGLNVSEWSSGDLHEALEVVWRAHTDLARAALLEEVADTIRARHLSKEYGHASGHRAA